MADLMSVAFWHCETAEGWECPIVGSKGTTYIVRFDGHNHKNPSVQYDFSCECKGYEWRGPAYCTHIRQAKAYHCGWMQFLHGGEPVEDDKGEKCCPVCLGSVKAALHGV